ncbi:hypothetical protein PT2222_90254 [Paraburkholderia tropica]
MRAKRLRAPATFRPHQYFTPPGQDNPVAEGAARPGQILYNRPRLLLTGAGTPSGRLARASAGCRNLRLAPREA